MKYLIKIKNFLVSLVFPEICLGCGADDTLFCKNCLDSISIRDRTDAHENLAISEHIDNIWISTDYGSEIIHKLVAAAKFHGSKQACRILGEIVYNFWTKLNISDFYSGEEIYLVPLPLHIRRRLERGYNQSELIAKAIADRFGLDVMNILKRNRYTSRQLKLDAKGRHENVKNCFVTKGIINKNKRYIIIDDVVTTGSTLNDAARALRQNGAKYVDILVVAKNKW